MRKTIADRIRLTLAATGWSQRELARRAGLKSESNIQQIIKTEGMHVWTLIAVADAANVSLTWLLTGRGRPLNEELRSLLFRLLNCSFFLSSPPTHAGSAAVEAADTQAVWDTLAELPAWPFLEDDAALPAGQRIERAIPLVRARIEENTLRTDAIEKQA